MFGRNKPEGKLCHETKFAKPCCKDVCPKWIKLQGVNPQNGQTVDEFACSDTWLPILLVEVSQKLVLLDATMHNFNNEVNRKNAVLNQSAQKIVQAIVGAQTEQQTRLAAQVD